MFLIGNGTSTLYSSQAAAYTARLCCPARRPAGPGLAGGRFRCFTPALSDQDVVVGITASGEFRDVLAVFERLEGKCLRVGITRPGIVRHAWYCSARRETGHVTVMTKTYASTLHGGSPAAPGVLPGATGLV